MPSPCLQNFHGHIAGFHVKTIDTTGAGDSFIGSLLCKLVKDASILKVNKNSLQNTSIIFFFSKTHSTTQHLPVQQYLPCFLYRMLRKNSPRQYTSITFFFSNYSCHQFTQFSSNISDK